MSDLVERLRSLADDHRARPQIAEHNWDDAAEDVFITTERGHKESWVKMRLTAFGDRMRSAARAEATANALHQAAAELESQAAEIARLRGEVEGLRVRSRLNVEPEGDDVLICFDAHEKGEPCEWERFVPAARAQSAETKLEVADALVRKLAATAIGAHPTVNLLIHEARAALDRIGG